MQEAARKDVERCFGVLQARFAVVKGPARFWREDDLAAIMKACIILHNMIIEDERNDEDIRNEQQNTIAAPDNNGALEFAEFLQRHRAIRDNVLHYQLRNDLIEHLWQREGDI
jgi:hypothetical protein